MQLYNYHWEVKDLLTQFLQAFDGAVVKRFDNARNEGAAVAVRYVYAPKQRVLEDIVNKSQTITLPVVAFNITSISRDVNRVFNKLDGHYYNINSTDTASVHTLQPVPVNITVNISILTKFQTDMDQILTNFVPWSDPYFIISWTNEALPGTEIRTEILWDGNLRLSYPTDINDQQKARVACDTTFTIKGWLFKANTGPTGRIFKINNNFYTSDTPKNEESYSAIANIMSELNGTPYMQTVTVSARPQIAYTDRWITPMSLSGTCLLLGNEFTSTRAVYVSGSVPGMFGDTTYILDSFEEIPSLSAKYPSLSGLNPAISYNPINDNKMIINYPAPMDTPGYFDVIVVNEAGYSILSKDTYQAGFPTQLPYALKGIEVVNVAANNILWENATFTWNGNTYTWLTV